MSYVDQISQELHEYIELLEEDAGTTRKLQNWTQLTGYAAAVIGAIAIPSPISWFAAIPASVGLISAISQTLAEARLTGRLQLLPFMDASPELLGSLLTVDTRGDVQDDSIDDYMYMPPKRRSEFAMVMYCGQSIATLLAGIEHPVTQRSVYQQLCRVFHQKYGRYVRCTPFLDRGMEAKGLNYQAPSAVMEQLSTAIKLPEASQQLIDSGVNKDNDIGLTTRLGGLKDNVVNTQAEALEPSSEVSRTSPTTNPTTSKTEHLPLVEDLARQVKNTLIAGKGGCGKGMIVSNAGRKVKGYHPDTLIYFIDLKDKHEERSYWSFADVYANRNCRDLDPVEIWDWVESCIREFQSLPAPKLLIVDEVKFLSASLGIVKGNYNKFWHVINAFTSLGDADGIHVWLMTQATHAKAIGDGGADLGQFRVIGVVDSSDTGYYDTLVGTNAVQKHSGDPSFVKQTLIARSPVGRVYFDSKTSKWQALPRLDNYSHIDRDAGAVNLPPSPSKAAFEALAAQPQSVVYKPQAQAVALDEAPNISIDPRLQKVADIFISDMRNKGHMELTKGKVFKELPTIRKHVRSDENSNDPGRVEMWTRALIRASQAGLITYREGENTIHFGLVDGFNDEELSHLFLD